VMIGQRVAGTAGAFCAAAGAVLPSFAVLVVVTLFYQAFLEFAVLAGALRGVRAAVAAVLFSAVLGLRKGTLRGMADWLICAAAALLVLIWDVNPIWVILGGGALGLLRYKLGARRGAA